MTQLYDFSQVIKQVSGLNSISTLKKWRLKIERLTGHVFKESRVRTGKQSYSRVYLFTEADIEKLQKIADLKGSFELEKAILKAYAPTRASPLSVNQRLNRLRLTFQLNRITQKVTDLTTQEQVLSIRVEQLSHRIEELEKAKRKKLFGK